MVPPRLLPDEPFPPYTFIPGRNPHPVSDPQGHAYGKPVEHPPAPNSDRWQESRAYLRGMDLFNYGYYWEAHEAWESLWHACGRTGPTADFLRGLIKLAAAGVKVREGVPRGVASHAARAAAIFQSAAQQCSEKGRMFGLRVSHLLACARAVEALAPTVRADSDAGVKIVVDFVLDPQATDEV